MRAIRADNDSARIAREPPKEKQSVAPRMTRQMVAKTQPSRTNATKTRLGAFAARVSSLLRLRSRYSNATHNNAGNLLEPDPPTGRRPAYVGMKDAQYPNRRRSSIKTALLDALTLSVRLLTFSCNWFRGNSLALQRFALAEDRPPLKPRQVVDRSGDCSDSA